ncbi:MAG: heparinase II/III family protein [Acidobacteria bacterium]|nr:heparinase II/III family protein [Acidobacteriota bacterium]
MTRLILLAAIPAMLSGAEWMVYDGTRIPVPPAAHPRLFLQSKDIPDLQRRAAHPQWKAVWERLQTLGEREPTLGVQADGLRYLMNRDETAGRRALDNVLRLMRETKFNPKQQDVTRPIGWLLMTAAVAYDWCYPLLTPADKKEFLDRMMTLTRSLECGYPPPKQGGVTGHYSEWMLMRDMLSAGVALYDEFPEVYQVATQRFFTVFVPVRNWWYRGGAFHQGTAYAETRASSELYPLWIFARMDAGPVYDPALQYLPYQWIYLRRPDGQLLRSGDGQFKSPGLRSLLNASYYGDGYVLADYLKNPRSDRGTVLFEFLWGDPDLKPRPLTELPLTRYMGEPYGWMVARSGWGGDSVIAEMKVNIFNFNNHQHLDAGAFQIFYKGPLAIDSGLYEGADGGYGSPHDVNYNKRTIAHNSLLVYDPEEKFARGTRPMRNDGGQRFPNNWREPRSLEDMHANYRTGEVEGQGFGPDVSRPVYSYLKGDLTKAYSAKVKRVQRSFVYLNLGGGPVKAALAVFDHVVAANPEHRKYWLLHSLESPRVDGSQITVAATRKSWQGKLVNTVLMPEGAEITPVGGPGKEFWVFGENFPNRPRSGDPSDFETGEWRVEVSPSRASSEDVFLNVMQVMDDAVAPLPVRRVDAGEGAGFELAGTTVLFRRSGERGQGTVEVQSQGRRLLLTDLAAGEWRVLRNGTRVGVEQVKASDGVLWWEGEPGRYRLEHVR